MIVYKCILCQKWPDVEGSVACLRQGNCYSLQYLLTNPWKLPESWLTLFVCRISRKSIAQGKTNVYPCWRSTKTEATSQILSTVESFLWTLRWFWKTMYTVSSVLKNSCNFSTTKSRLSYALMLKQRSNVVSVRDHRTKAIWSRSENIGACLRYSFARSFLSLETQGPLCRRKKSTGKSAKG